jgi:hypothetical protein
VKDSSKHIELYMLGPRQDDNPFWLVRSRGFVLLVKTC